MVSQIKSYIGSAQGSSGTFGDTDLPEFAPEWIPLPDLDTNFLDLPDSFNVAPYARGRPAPTFTSDIGVMTPEGILTIPAGTAIGPLVITITASNSEGDTPTTLNWDITVEDTPEPTLYVNSLYAGGNPPATPPTNHARGFGTGDASEEIGRDNATHIYTTSGDSERWYLIHNETNYPDLEVGKGYVFAVDIECFAGSNTNAIALSNPVNITVGPSDRTCAPGEHKICYVTFTVDALGYAFTYLCGTGITTGRSETYRFHTPRLIELGEIVPIWDEVPPQETNVADLPDQLDMKDFILNDILIIDWDTTFGEIDVDGILKIPVGTEPDTYPIIVTAISTAAQSDSDEFIWRILPVEVIPPPVWGIVDDLDAEEGEEYQVPMTNWILSGDDLENWSLSGNPAGVTIDQNGLVTILASVGIATLVMDCTVENQGGQDTSNIFTWELTATPLQPPIWLEQPEDQTTSENDLPGEYDVSDLVFSLSPIVWAVTPPATIDNVDNVGLISITASVDTYPLLVNATNTGGSTPADDPFNWEITEDDLGEIEINTQPQDMTVVEPDDAWFRVDASHTGGENLFYQWFASEDGNTWVDPRELLSNVNNDSIIEELLILPSTSSSDLLFTSNFNALDDWHGDINDTDNSFPWDSAIIPAGWHVGRNQPEWAPSTGDLDRHETVEILAANADKARGGTGKSFVHWRDAKETLPTVWLGDGMLTWYAGDSVEHEELYVEFYIRISPEMLASYYATGVGQNPGVEGEDFGAAKIFRIYHWNSVEADYFNYFDNDATNPKWIWDITTSTFGYRNFQSLRARSSNPNSINPASWPTPNMSNGDWSGNWSESSEGQAEDDGDPQIIDKKNGGFLPIGSGQPTVQLDQILGGNNEEWTKFGFYLKMNSAPGIADGIATQWIDDERILHANDVPWIDTGQDMVGWNIVALGGNHYFPAYPDAVRHEEWYSIDDVKIYTSKPESE